MSGAGEGGVLNPGLGVAMIRRAARWFEVASDWRRRSLLFSAGAASVLSLAPFHLWPVLWLTIPVLFLAIFDKRTAEGSGDASGAASVGRHRLAFWRQTRHGTAAENAWWFGFGFFIVGLFWIAEAFLVEAEIFAWLIPVAVTGLPALLALFYAGAGWVLSRLTSSSTTANVLFFAVVMSLVEWGRSHAFTGLPWNVFGYALAGPVTMMQAAGIAGIFGLTLLAFLVFTWPAVRLMEEQASARQSWGRQWIMALVPALAGIGLLYGYGTWRLAAAPAIDTRPATGYLVRIVQPSIPQRQKWQPEHQRRIFDLHKSLSGLGAEPVLWNGRRPDAVVWPESAMPFFPLEQPIALAEIGELLGDETILVAGGIRRQSGNAVDGGNDFPPVYNSLFVFRGGLRAELVDTYDKAHLVPFGEFLPLKPLLGAIGLQQLVRRRGGFTEGPMPRPLLDLGGGRKAIPSICYEAIFPQSTRGFDGQPLAIINVTNDGWFGDSIGPRQHYHQARVRAVESGLPMIRVANNGISALLDGFGRELARIGLDVEGFSDTVLPMPAGQPLYARFGDKLYFLAVAILIGLGIALTYRNTEPIAPKRDTA